MSNNTIFRSPKSKENPFAQISRSLLQDKTLSYEARGLLAYVLSHSNNWKINIKDLQQKCSSDRVYRILNELIEKGYVKRKRIVDAKGKFTGICYWTYEEPTFDEDDSPLRENPDMENAQKEKPEILLNRDNNEIEKENKRFTDKSVNGNAQALMPDTFFPLAVNLQTETITDSEDRDKETVLEAMTTGGVTLTEKSKSQKKTKAASPKSDVTPPDFQAQYLRMTRQKRNGKSATQAKRAYFEDGLTLVDLITIECLMLEMSRITRMDYELNVFTLFEECEKLWKSHYLMSDLKEFEQWWSTFWKSKNGTVAPNRFDIREHIAKIKETMPSSEPLTTSESVYGSYAKPNLNDLE